MNFIKKYFWLGAIVVIGSAIRLYTLNFVSLWHDEAFSALLIKYSWSEMLHRIGLDVHPPLYYILLRLWHYVFGHSLWSLRGFSVLFSVLLIIAVYVFIVKFFHDKRMAIIATALLAFSPFQIQYSTEARMYTLGAFLAVLTMYFLATALRKQAKDMPSRSWSWPTAGWFILYSIFASGAMYTHYYLLFIVAGVGLYAILFTYHKYGLSISQYKYVVMAGLLQLILYIPWLNTFIFQFKQVGADYWIPKLNIRSIPDTLWQLLIGINTNALPNNTTLIIISIVTVGILGYVACKYFKDRTEPFELWLVIIGFLSPFIGALAFLVIAKLNKENSSVYLVRYFLFNSAFLVILIAYVINKIRIKQIGIMVLLGLICANIFATANSYASQRPDQKPGMKKASQLLNTNVEPDHKLYIASSFEFFNFKYYNQTPLRPLLYTGGITDISQMPHYSGTAILENSDLLPTYELAPIGSTVWVLWTNAFGGNPPEVPSNWTSVNQTKFPDLKPYPGTDIIVEQYLVN